MVNNSVSLSHLRILLAEDDATTRKVILLMLDRLGYKADIALNGQEVLRALEMKPYDLVLMDIVMPKMDGLEAARKIREHWKDWPKIIAFTAYLLPDILEKCTEAGMDGYLAKPVRLNEMQAMLKHFDFIASVKRTVPSS
ncbi:MAG: response regulator [Methanotrichaceae archaeon]